MLLCASQVLRLAYRVVATSFDSGLIHKRSDGVSRWLAVMLALAPCVVDALPGHPEIVVACDSKSNLVAVFDAGPLPLPVSRFPGMPGYADAMPGISSLFQATPEKGHFPPDPQSKIVFVFEGADEGMAVWNDHGSALMRAGETFNLGNPFFDSHPIWNVVNGTPGARYAIRLRLRDLTGRYHDSEIFSPTFAPVVEGQIYGCPMKCQGANVSRIAGFCPVCGMRLKLLGGGAYRVKFQARDRESGQDRIVPGKEALLQFGLLAPDGSPVKDLEIVHEKLLHLLVVSEDLSWFAHEHPVAGEGGRFTLGLTFPRAGAYTLFHDFTPAKAGMQVVPVEVPVVGQRPAPLALTPTRERVQQIDGYDIELKTGETVRSLQMEQLTFRISRNDEAVTDLEPYLGALGHLIIISRDRKQFVHSHPLPRAADQGTGEAASGPEVVFNAQFPAAGLYKAWGQFQHKGKVITAPFVFDVIAPVKN